MAAKKPKDDPFTAIVRRTAGQGLVDNARTRQPSKDNILQRIVGETLIIGSHPEGFMKGVEARVNELDRAKHTNEAEQVLIELVAAYANIKFPISSRSLINAFEKARNYLRKRGYVIIRKENIP
jgi:putative ribosome biogenesis GTPase RsgA